MHFVRMAWIRSHKVLLLFLKFIISDIFSAIELFFNNRDNWNQLLLELFDFN